MDLSKEGGAVQPLSGGNSLQSPPALVPTGWWGQQMHEIIENQYSHENTYLV
jgi:hypothetical protein